MLDIHNCSRRLESVTNNLKNNPAISGDNKQLIIKFKDDCLLEISPGRTIRYVQNLVRISMWLNNDFNECSKEDIKSLVAYINDLDYKDWTKQLYKVTIRKFYKWLRNTEDYPEEVKWIKTTVKNNNRMLPEELLSEEDIQKLIESADHPRDRAFISTLYESGCRIGEIATLKLKHTKTDRYGIYFGWVQASEMASVYVHLSGRDVDKALLKIHGIEEEENGKEESVLKPKTCQRCSETNPATNRFCQKCGMVIDKKTMIEIVEKDMKRGKADDIMDKMLQDQRFREMFMEKIKEVVG